MTTQIPDQQDISNNEWLSPESATGRIETPVHHITQERLFDAPPAIVWAVMTDPDVYAAVAPNLTHVEVLSGATEGMVRECTDTDGNVWTETCTHWVDDKSFAVEVDVATSDFHKRLFSHFAGEWRITERSDDVLATVSFTHEMRYGPIGRLLARIMEPKASSLISAIFDGWQTEIDRRLETPDAEPEAVSRPN